MRVLLVVVGLAFVVACSAPAVEVERVWGSGGAELRVEGVPVSLAFHSEVSGSGECVAVLDRFEVDGSAVETGEGWTEAVCTVAEALLPRLLAWLVSLL